MDFLEKENISSLHQNQKMSSGKPMDRAARLRAKARHQPRRSGSLHETKKPAAADMSKRMKDLQENQEAAFENERADLRSRRERLEREKIRLENRRKELEHRAAASVRDILEQQKKDDLQQQEKKTGGLRPRSGAVHTWEHVLAQPPIKPVPPAPNNKAGAPATGSHNQPPTGSRHAKTASLLQDILHGNPYESEKDKRYLYWESFWKKVQELRTKFRTVQEQQQAKQSQNAASKPEHPAKTRNSAGRPDPGPGPRGSSGRNQQRERKKGSGSSKRGGVDNSPYAPFPPPRSGVSSSKGSGGGVPGYSGGAKANASPPRARRYFNSNRAPAHSSSSSAQGASGPGPTTGSSRAPSADSGGAYVPGARPRAHIPSTSSNPHLLNRNARQRQRAQHGRGSFAAAARSRAASSAAAKQAAAHGPRRFGAASKQSRGEPPPRAAKEASRTGAASGEAKTTSRSADEEKSRGGFKSNVERFFAEEKQRKTKQKLREKKRQAQRSANEKEEARKMWEKLRKDVETKWREYREKRPEAADPPNDPEEQRRRRQSFEAFKQSFLRRRDASRGSYSNAHQRAPSSGASSSAATVNVRASIQRMSVRELKTALAKAAGVSVLKGVGVVEKQDLMVRLEQEFRKQAQEEKARKKEQERERARERARQRIISEVEKWAKGKNIKAMLNDINGWTHRDDRMLQRRAGFTPVSKAYKRALLKIHPDKHNTEFEAHVRATEMFKEVNSKFSQYKARLRR